MTPLLPYWLRLICLTLSAGTLSYLAGWLLALSLTTSCLHHARRGQDRNPALAARQLLRLRLLPLALSLFVVGGLCLPSYIWLEPAATGERWGWGFCLAAVLGLALLAASLRRLFTAWHQQRILIHRARRLGRVLVVPGPEPVMALCGILRPRLLISRNLLQQLSPLQRQAGQRHERAHLRARDNLKRLLILASPAPGARFRRLETAWAHAAEWAADDRAVAGDAHCSVALAATLLAVARLCPATSRSTPLGLALRLQGDGGDLAARVRRLLAPRSAAVAQGPIWPTWLGAALLLAAMLQPASLLAAHHILEILVR